MSLKKKKELRHWVTDQKVEGLWPGTAMATIPAQPYSHQPPVQVWKRRTKWIWLRVITPSDFSVPEWKALISQGRCSNYFLWLLMARIKGKFHLRHQAVGRHPLWLEKERENNTDTSNEQMYILFSNCEQLHRITVSSGIKRILKH